MQLRNNYDKGVFNGDLDGCLHRPRRCKIRVDYDERVVEYEADEWENQSGLRDLDQKARAGISRGIYRCTFAYIMLTQILYTAVTRGKKLVTSWQPQSARHGDRNVRVEIRDTGLKEG